jgi:adenylylsulfate kinase
MEQKDIISKNVFSANGLVSREEREKILDQQSFTIWVTGLSASGKSTLASSLERKLFDMDYLAYVLDGDNLRHGINCNLGFSHEERKENIRRTAEIAKILNSAGIISIVALISPFIKDRELSRNIIGKNSFIEVYVKCSIEICEQRDPKGLYKRARLGEVSDFTGIESPYEVPEHPDIVVQTDVESPDECIEKIINFLIQRKFINTPELTISSR